MRFRRRLHVKGGLHVKDRVYMRTSLDEVLAALVASSLFNFSDNSLASSAFWLVSFARVLCAISMGPWTMA